MIFDPLVVPSPARRHFLRAGMRVLVAAGCAPVLSQCQPASDPEGASRVLVAGGFVPRIVARSGYRSSANSEYVWHRSPDGGACFDTGDGGWIYVSNSESKFAGGCGAIRFDANGTLVDSYSILSGSRQNCSGCATPWHTWLSCEELSKGQVWECDPFANISGIAHPALGKFAHESATVDPLTYQIYMTEDKTDGCLYRFTPAAVQLNAPADLSRGRLEIARIVGESVQWQVVPDPGATKTPLRYQIKDVARFDGGEGIDIYDRFVRFTTKNDNLVWQLNLMDNRIQVIQNLAGRMTDIDDITHTSRGEMLIAEDGKLMRILYLPENSRQPVTLVQLPDHGHSEITGLAFDPVGLRLYFSSQRGSTGKGSHGLTFELFGNFLDIGSEPRLNEWILEHREIPI